MKKRKLIWIGLVVILIVVFSAFVLNVLFKVHTYGNFVAEWGAGDAMNFAASIFGVLGTIALGCVAYKQNDKLQKISAVL